MLALTRGRSLSRKVAEEWLWSDSGEAQRQVSLRQTLAHIRRSLGREFVLATRDTCSFPSHLSLWVDVDDGPLSEGEDLLPDFRERWFDAERLRRGSRFDDSGLASAEAALPVDSLLSLLSHYADSKPSAVLELMRDHAGLAEGISYRALKPILQKTLNSLTPDDPLYGWGLYLWASLIHCTGNIWASFAPLDLAADFAGQVGDRGLLINAVIVKGIGQVLAGQLATGERTVLSVKHLVGGEGSPGYERFQSAYGALLNHQGRAKDGVDVLEGLGTSGSPGGPDPELSAAIRALFLATSGRDQAASDVLYQVENSRRSSGSVNLNFVNRLTRGHIALNQGDLEAAERGFRDLTGRAMSTDGRHYVIYSRESHAIALWKLGDREAAVREKEAAEVLRKRSGMALTAWDKSRHQRSGRS